MSKQDSMSLKELQDGVSDRVVANATGTIFVTQLTAQAKTKWASLTLGKQVLFTVLPLLGLGLLWQITVWTLDYPAAILPGPVEVFKALVDMIELGVLWSDIGVSFYRLGVGLVVGLVIGTAIGLAMGVSHVWERIATPLMNFGLATPGIAFIPLAILWFGLTDLTVISILIVEVVLVVMLMTWTAVRGVDKAVVAAARTMGFRGMKMFVQVLLPASLLGIIGGYRMAFSRAWRALIGCEMLAGVAGGLGYRIAVSQTEFQSPRVYAGIIVIGVIGILLERVLLRALEVNTVERWGGN